MLETFTTQTFAPYVNSVFRLYLTAESGIELKLGSVTNLGAGNAASQAPVRREQFSLLFHGPLRPILPQRIYHLEHAELGALDIFLVPVGPDQAGMQYEAVFA